LEIIMTRITTLSLAVLLVAGTSWAQDIPGPGDIPQPEPIPINRPPAPQPKPRPVIKADENFEAPNPIKLRTDFAKAIAGSDQFNAKQKQAVAKLVAAAKDDKAAAGRLISDSLRMLYPDFDRAMKLLGAERADEALPVLSKLTKSDDSYLSAYARFYSARAYQMEERYEEALPLLVHVTDKQLDRTLHSGEAMFMRGVAEAETLKRKDAIRTLKTFAKNYPFSSERTIIGALHLIDELSYLEAGSIVDVQDRMDYSRRRLDIQKSGDTTQGEQTRIIAMIDKLIEEAEQKEKEGGGGGGGGGGQGSQPGQGGNPQGNQQPGGPADQSSVSPGQARIGDLGRVIRGTESWGEARSKEREEVLNAIKAKYPERYRELVEQYYKSLQEDNR
jgi:tetratricopeptide (TPR) repeat protein